MNPDRPKMLSSIGAVIKKIAQKRIVRFAIIGGIGIPINWAALAFFMALLVQNSNNVLLFLLANACAFEVSTLTNFILNQLFTYNDQIPKNAKEWLAKIFKAQIANISAFLVAWLIGSALAILLQMNPFLANTLGLICNFIYKFLVSDKFVFRKHSLPEKSRDTESIEQKEREDAMLVDPVRETVKRVD